MPAIGGSGAQQPGSHAEKRKAAWQRPGREGGLVPRQAATASGARRTLKVETSLSASAAGIQKEETPSAEGTETPSAEGTETPSAEGTPAPAPGAAGASASQPPCPAKPRSGDDAGTGGGGGQWRVS